MLTQQIANGLTIGLVYGLLAIGLAMAYSTTKIVNFAHGELFTLGAFIGLTLQRYGHLPFTVAAGLAVVAVFLLVGLFAYLILWKLKSPLERSISTIALGLALRDLMLVLFGSDSESFAAVYPEGTLSLGSLTISYATIVICLATVVLLTATSLFVHKTRCGIWMRATAQNEHLAATTGIPTRQVQAGAFAGGAALAAVAGLLITPQWQVYYGAGTTVGLKAFTAALIFGFGSFRGALIGGIVVGVVEALLAGYVSSTWKDSGVYVFLIVAMVLMPRLASMLRKVQLA
jgi:branched-chain amino acid transport system permease protein